MIGAPLLRVLHIEDDLFTQGFVKVALQDKVDLTSVATLQDARLLISTHEYDVILADLYLPDAVGLETLSSWWPHFIPTIVISNDDSPATLKRADSMGAYDYISKANLSKINLLSHIKIAVDKHKEENARKKGRWLDDATFERVKPYIACAAVIATPFVARL